MYDVAAEALVDQYNQENPNVKVEYQSVPWDNYYQTFFDGDHQRNRAGCSHGRISDSNAVCDHGGNHAAYPYCRKMAERKGSDPG